MTTPYVTGTVSVTAGSAIVTGVGTGWLTSGLVAGTFGLDSANGNPVPVLSVDSDTQITLAKPWRGTTVSGQAYWITYDTQPGQQTVLNAQRLAEYIARLDKAFFSAFANVIPVADKVPYIGAGGVGALADFNAAARALLAGTGSVTDAQTPDGLRVDKVITDANAFTSRGWARGNNIANAPTNTGDGDWYIYRNDILSGFGRQWAYSFFTDRIYQRRYTAPTFSAWKRADSPERGSNANGEYVRFADGTQICTGRFTGYSANAFMSKPYAASFINSEVVTTASINPVQSFDYQWTTFTDGPSAIGFNSTSSFNGNVVNWVAIGRWF